MYDFLYGPYMLSKRPILEQISEDGGATASYCPTLCALVICNFQLNGNPNQIQIIWFLNLNILQTSYALFIVTLFLSIFYMEFCVPSGLTNLKIKYYQCCKVWPGRHSNTSSRANFQKEMKFCSNIFKIIEIPWPSLKFPDFPWLFQVK